MALTVGSLVARITIDTRGFDRGIRDAHGRLRDARGRFITESNAMGSGILSGILGPLRRVTGLIGRFGPIFAAGGAGAIAALAAVGAAARGLQMAMQNASLAAGVAILAIGIKAQLATEQVKKSFEDAGKKITESFTRASSALGPVLQKLAGRASSVVTGLEPTFKRFFDRVSPALDRVFAALEKAFKNPAVAKFIDDAGIKLTDFLDKLAQNLPKILSTIKQVFLAVKEAVDQVVVKTQPFVDLFKAAWPIVKEILTAVKNLSKALVDGFGKALQPAIDHIKELAGDKGFLQKMKQLFKDLEPVARFLGKVLGTVLGLALVALVETVKLVVNAWDSLKRKWNEAKVWIDEQKKKWNDFKISLGKFKDDIVRWFQELPGKLRKIGSDMLQGLIDGAKSKWNDLTRMAGELKDKVVTSIKNFFGIKSPSKVMAELGGYLAKGLVNGTLSGLSGFNFSGVLRSVFGMGAGDDPLKWLAGNLGKVGSKLFTAIPDLAGTLFSKAGGLIKGIPSWFGGLFGGAGSGGAGVQRWAPAVLQALSMLGQPASWLGTVLRRMSQESGGNPRAINLWDCVTLSTMILTKRGWLKHDEVHPGDETIGYNPATGHSEWTPITRVIHYADAPLVRIGHSRWHATTTPNHRWWSEPAQRDYGDVTSCPLCPWPDMPAPPPPLATCPECGWVPLRPGGVALHRARKHGVPGARHRGEREHAFRRRGKTTTGGLQIHMKKMHGQDTPYERTYGGEFITTEAINTQTRLRLAAPAATDSTLNVTVAEAALLGWIAGDGHIERQCPTPEECARRGYADGGKCREHSARQNPTISVAQSKPAMVAKLRTLLDGVPHAVYVDERPTRTGKTACGPRYQFRLDYRYAQELMARAGHPKADAVTQVLAMSSEQRAAWLEAIIDAEGSVTKQPTHIKAQTLIYQSPGKVLEAITLAVYLSGSRPRVLKSQRSGGHGWAPEFSVRVNEPIVTGAFLDKKDAGRGDVWCVTTELGTWTAREEDHIFLTGNSNALAGHPSKGLMQTIGPTFAAYRHPGLSGNIFDPLSNIYAGLNYALHRYGSLGALNRPGGYDSGGWLMPGTTLTTNKTGKPEAILTHEQWEQVSQAAMGGHGVNITVNNRYPQAEPTSKTVNRGLQYAAVMGF